MIFVPAQKLTGINNVDIIIIWPFAVQNYISEASAEDTSLVEGSGGILPQKSFKFGG